ncbi:MAG: 4Fe-4S binding protein [Candidatus Bathyarchaeia archaeon]
MIPSDGSTAQIRTGDWRTLRPVINYSVCNMCGRCWAYCPEPAIVLKGDEYVIEYEHCKGCGICAVECPLDCVSMVREGEEE